MSSGERGSPSLSDVEAVVRENVSGHVDGDEHEHGKQQLLAALRERRRRPPRSRPNRWLLLGGALALLAAGGAVYKQRQPGKLSYQLSGGLISDSGYVRSIGASGAQLSFSDGTLVELQDGTRARIARLDPREARIAIENGHATLKVARSGAGRWFVDAGPFVIRVTGTRFDVDWSSYDDTLSVDLHEGSLTVSGPPAPSGVLLHAGQRLTAHEGRLSIEALETAAQVVQAAPVIDPFALPDPDVAAPPSAAPPAGEAGPASSF